jgi:hypothetical protein
MKMRLILVAVAIVAVGCGRQSNPTPASSPAKARPAVAAADAGNSAPPATSEPAAETSPGATATPEAAGAPASGTSGAAEGQNSFAIPAGTRIRVRLDQTIDTRAWRAGRRFRASLDAPVILAGRVVVPRSTVFTGHVVESKPSGRLKGRAYLSVALDSFRMQGQTYSIRTTADVRVSGSHKKRNLAFIGGGSAGGAAIGAIAHGGVGAVIGSAAGAAAGTTGALITGKKHVTLPAETPMVFTLRNRVRVAG